MPELFSLTHTHTIVQAHRSMLAQEKGGVFKLCSEVTAREKPWIETILLISGHINSVRKDLFYEYNLDIPHRASP